jgi:hypothetical protein
VKHTVNHVSDATRKDENKGNEVGQRHVPLGNETTNGAHEKRRIECHENLEARLRGEVAAHAEESAWIQGILQAQGIGQAR